MMARMAGKEVKIEVNTTLQLDAEGRVVHHQDSWEGRSSMPRFFRAMGGSMTNLLLRATGANRK